VGTNNLAGAKQPTREEKKIVDIILIIKENKVLWLFKLVCITLLLLSSSLVLPSK